MIPVPSTHPAGTVILATAGQPRFAEFWSCFAFLQVPSGTRFVWQRVYDAAQGRNEALRQRKGAWSFFLDDDHTFAPDVLMKLLDAQETAIAPMTCRRAEPFEPIVCRPDASGPFAWHELTGHGVLRLPHGSYTGMGGFLAREDVISKIDDPWFRVGQFRPGHMEEDRWFCHQIWNVGGTISLHRDIILGHTDTCTLLPEQTPEGWQIALLPGRGQRMY